MAYTHDAGFAYTVATGRLFCPMEEFHRRAEELLARPVMTHEFASDQTWTDMRGAFEQQAMEEIGDYVR